jgi:NADPH2:quinone reductase
MVQEMLLPEVQAGEVLVKVMACGINRLDTAQRKGVAKPPPGASDVLGLEVQALIYILIKTRQHS